MAKIRLAFPVDGIRGAIRGRSGLVYFLWRGLQVARRFVIPANPDSTAQQTVRAWFTAAAQQFGSISPAEKTGWETYAQLVPRQVDGQTLILPAIDAYLEINSIRQLAGQAITDTAPTALADFAVTAIADWVDATPDIEFDVTHSATVTAGRFLYIKMTAPLNSARVDPPASAYRSAIPPQTGGTIVALAASPQTVTLTLADLWTGFSVGDFAGISAQPLSTQYVPGLTFRQVLEYT